MTMGDRVAVMRRGKLQQVAQPEALYRRPVNAFVAGFIGSPAMNMLQARVARENGALAVVAGETRFELSDDMLASHRGLAAYEGKAIVLGIRPESLEDAALANGDGQPRMRGTAELREALGPEILMHFSVAATPAITDDLRELAEDVGDDRAGQLGGARPDSAQLVGRFSPESRVREGDEIEVAIDARSLHFFDAESGLAIYDA